MSVGDESQSITEVLLNYASSLATRFKRSKKLSDKETAMEVSREVLCTRMFYRPPSRCSCLGGRFSAQTMSRQQTECFRKPSNYYKGSYPEASCGATSRSFFLKFPGSQQMLQPSRSRPPAGTWTWRHRRALHMNITVKRGSIFGITACNRIRDRPACY